MCTLSIIIPIYNVEDYLEQCIESICSQYQEDMQIICVDDCSTDASYTVLEKCCQKYSFIEKYVNEYNMGLAAARNEGLNHAKGKYIMFVDSDDYVKEGGLVNLVSIAQKMHLDILSFSVQMFADEGYESQANLDRRIRKGSYKVTTGAELMCEFIKNDEMFGAVWGAIYRQEYLKKLNLRFIENILHEDIPFVFTALLNAKRAYAVNEVIYFYRQRATSILNKPDYNKLLSGLVVGYMEMLISWHHFIINNDIKKDEYIKEYLETQRLLIEDRHARLLMSGGKVTNKAVLYFMDNLYENKDLGQYFTEQDVFKIKNNKNIVIYGAGCIATKIMLLFNANKISVNKVYVSNKENNPEVFFGIEVEEFTKADINECIVIAVSTNIQEEIIKKFKKGYEIVKTIME